MCKPSPTPDVASPVFFIIGELAGQVGLSPAAIRFYEHQGLIKPGRHGRLRIYSSADANRLMRIVQLRAIGLPVKTIGRLIRSLPETGDWLNSGLVKQALEAHRGELVCRQAVIAKQLQTVAALLGETAK